MGYNEKYHNQMSELAKKAFKDHQIAIKLSDRHWIIRRPYKHNTIII